jgi:hypothetical protein
VHKELASRLELQRPNTFEKAIRYAVEYEDRISAQTGAYNTENVNNKKKIHLSLVEDKPSTEDKRYSKICEKLSQLQRTINEKQPINSTNAYQTRNNSGLVCFACNKKGHGFMRCFGATEAEKNKIRDKLRREKLNNSSSNSAKSIQEKNALNLDSVVLNDSPTLQ